jgi:hypothetical protein
LKNNQIKCKASQYVISDIDVQLQAAVPVPTLGGAFWIKYALSVASTNNDIKYCYLCDVGGGFYLEQTSFTDTGSTLSFNSALQGGAFYC